MTKKKKDKTAHERGKKFTAKQVDKDLIRVHPWVPRSCKEELLAFAKKLRDENHHEACLCKKCCGLED